MGGPDSSDEVGGVCETKTGTEAKVEDEDEDVDFVGSIDEIGVYGYESQGFTFSRTLRRKGLAKKNVSEGVVDTVYFPQCAFSSLEHLHLALLLEPVVLIFLMLLFFAGQSLNSIRLVVLRVLKHEDDFVRLLCFSV